MTITRAEIEGLRRSLAVFSPPVEAYARDADADDWAVGSVGRGHWDIVDITEERARSIVALLNALPSLLDAADERDGLVEEIKHVSAGRDTYMREWVDLANRASESLAELSDERDRLAGELTLLAKERNALIEMRRQELENSTRCIVEALSERDRLRELLTEAKDLIGLPHPNPISLNLATGLRARIEAELACGQAVVKRETQESE